VERETADGRFERDYSQVKPRPERRGAGRIVFAVCMAEVRVVKSDRAAGRVAIATVDAGWAGAAQWPEMQRKKKLLLEAVFCGLLLVFGKYLHLNSIGSIPFFARDHALLSHRKLWLACACGWVAFSLYWEIAARNVAETKSSESRASRGLHVFLTNVAVLLQIAPIRGLGRFLPVSSSIMVTGLAIEAGGLYLAIWARRHLGRFWSGEIAIKVEHELIRSGPYKLMRHPIYTGLLTMYVGTALVVGSWLAIIGLAVGLFAYWRKIQLEETNLRVAFGAKYEDYCRTTWALVPGLPPRRKSSLPTER